MEIDKCLLHVHVVKGKGDQQNIKQPVALSVEDLVRKPSEIPAPHVMEDFVNWLIITFEINKNECNKENRNSHLVFDALFFRNLCPTTV